MKKLILFIATISSFGTVSAQEFIRVNQIGYYSKSPKIAILANMNATSFQIRKVNSEEIVVYEGKLSDGKFWNQSGETVQIADFSDFKIPGRYFIRSKKEKSYPFEIKEQNLFDSLSIWSLKAFYLWRASIEIKSEYAAFGKDNYARKAGHPDDIVYIHSSTASKNRPDGTIVSASKGWYDAGDYNKYVVNAGISAHSLITAYEMFPEYYKKLNFHIPESGNNIPDILNELKWEFDWLFEMQDPHDGGVYNKLTSLTFCGMISPDLDTSERYMVGKSTTAALNFAAIMAMGSRVFKEYEEIFPGFSKKALIAAEKAWDWASIYNNIAFKNPPDVRTGGYADEEFEDEFFWAASELLVTTGNKKYYDKLDFFQKFDTPTWRYVSSLGLISMQNHLKNLPAFVEKEQITRKFKSLAENVYNQYKFSPNLVPIKKFEWGSNGVIATNGVILGVAYFQQKEEKYLSGMISCLNYLLGTNPTEYSFVTRFGSKYPKHIHDRRNEGNNIKEPLPGYLVGGSNPNQVADCGRSSYISILPARCYIDDACSYSTNEVAINWNAPFALLVGMVENAFNK